MSVEANPNIEIRSPAKSGLSQRSATTKQRDKAPSLLARRALASPQISATGVRLLISNRLIDEGRYQYGRRMPRAAGILFRNAI
jgi:hypothetical protein